MCQLKPVPYNIHTKDGTAVVTRTECYKRHMPHVTTVTRRELQMLQRACYNCYKRQRQKDFANKAKQDTKHTVSDAISPFC